MYNCSFRIAVTDILTRVVFVYTFFFVFKLSSENTVSQSHLWSFFLTVFSGVMLFTWNKVCFHLLTVSRTFWTLFTSWLIWVIFYWDMWNITMVSTVSAITQYVQKYWSHLWSLTLFSIPLLVTFPPIFVGNQCQ